MRIIEKISIKHFRSFDGGVNQPKAEIVNLKDINIFSGANDSGKSNILRALNLFFNNEISPGVPFDLTKDLSKIQKKRSDEKALTKRNAGEGDVRQRDLWVQIRVHFIKDMAGILPKSFWVEKMWDKNGANYKRKSNIQPNADPNKTRAQEGQLTQFLNSIRFEYVPAVKDRQFFNYLFFKLQTYLFEKQDKKKENKFRTHSQAFNELLKDETSRLFEEFKNSTNIQAQFSIPETLVDFFRTLSVRTEDDISLFDRGDGVQARFIPDILNEITRESQKKIIWGFEEPENSYEPLRCFELAQDFLKYSKEKQIFITSHAFPFIALKGVNISSYRVKKRNSASHVGEINWNKRLIPGLGLEDNVEELEREVGILETYQKLSEHLGREANKRKHNVFVEDSKTQIYKIAWLKLNNVQFTESDMETKFNERCDFNIFPKNGRMELRKHLDAVAIEEYTNDKIVGIFDFDEAFKDFDGLHIERWEPIQGAELSCLSRKRKSHKCFYSVLIPVPVSRNTYAQKAHQHHHLTLEHLFEDSVLSSIGCNGGTVEPSANLSIVKIKAKQGFWKKILNLPRQDFSNFEPLFKKIKEIFN